MSSQWPLLAASKFNPFFLTFYCILMLAKYCLDLGTLQTYYYYIFKISVQCRNSIFLFLCDSHCHDQMSQAAGENNFGHLDFSATFVENFLMLQSTTDTGRNKNYFSASFQTVRKCHEFPGNFSSLFFGVKTDH